MTSRGLRSNLLVHFGVIAKLVTKAGTPIAHPTPDVQRSADTWLAASRNFAAPEKPGSSGTHPDADRSAPIFALIWRAGAHEFVVLHAFFEFPPKGLEFCGLYDMTQELVFAAIMEISCVRLNQQPCWDSQNPAPRRGLQSRGNCIEWYRKRTATDVPVGLALSAGQRLSPEYLPMTMRSPSTSR